MGLDVKSIIGNIIRLFKKKEYVIFSLLAVSGIIIFLLLNGNPHKEDTQTAAVPPDPRIDFFQPSPPTHFPLSEGLRPQVEFWKKIFTEYTSRHAVVHDRRHVSIIYTVVDLDERQIYSDRAKKKAIRSALKKYKRMLRKLKRMKPADIEKLSEDEKRVLNMIKEAPGVYRLSRAGRNFGSGGRGFGGIWKFKGFLF